MQVDIANHDAIKRDLRAAGIKLVDIAAELRCPPSLVTMVSQGRRRSQEIELAIASRLDRSPAELWPDRYK
ncbi:helix-turn-helix domain-containing protein [Paracoccus sp. S1E-3]|uniref:helix-turn-helix domain-containing protein n=2 Tax=Paracoccus TaxID=265 RepID=UPI0015EE8691|nr:helix-turn-helix domain-containing protein [Paracoccus sp. S1E-3]